MRRCLHFHLAVLSFDFCLCYEHNRRKTLQSPRLSLLNRYFSSQNMVSNQPAPIGGTESSRSHPRITAFVNWNSTLSYSPSPSAGRTVPTTANSPPPSKRIKFSSEKMNRKRRVCSLLQTTSDALLLFQTPNYSLVLKTSHL